MLDTKVAAGPLDRTSFFDEPRRRRRQTGPFTGLCAVAAALAGVPLATSSRHSYSSPRS